jgi:hypothetical protein
MYLTDYSLATTTAEKWGKNVSLALFIFETPLQCIKNVLAQYLLWGRRRNGGMMAMTRCRVGCRGDRDEFDNGVRRIFVNFNDRREAGLEREVGQYLESDHAPGPYGLNNA